MNEVMNRTYHIAIEVDGNKPKEFMETILSHGLEANLDPDIFFLPGHSVDIDGESFDYIALTVQEPYEHEDGSRYTPVVEPEHDMIESVLQHAVRQFDGLDKAYQHSSTDHIVSFSDGCYDLFRSSMHVIESNPAKQHYDEYSIKLYFVLPD